MNIGKISQFTNRIHSQKVYSELLKAQPKYWVIFTQYWVIVTHEYWYKLPNIDKKLTNNWVLASLTNVNFFESVAHMQQRH